MSNELKIFNNDEFGEVRITTIDNEPYFVGKDIAVALGYKDTSDALKRHVDDEDKLTRCFTDSGQSRQMIIINESGLYSLTLSSKLKSAKKFKRWITSEVLPTIRKTGGYINNDEIFIETYLPFADSQTRILFKTTLETVRKQNNIIQKQKEEIEHKEDVIIGLVDEITIAEKRQILNRVMRNNHANYQLRWQMLYREFDNKYHINSQARMNTYNETHKPKCKNRLDYIDNVMNKIPELYELAAKLFENDVKELVEQMYLAVSI